MLVINHFEGRTKKIFMKYRYKPALYTSESEPPMIFYQKSTKNQE